MIKTVSSLIADINQYVKTNNNGEITGQIMNDVLRDMSESLNKSYFEFPKDESLSVADIGKLVMNDGSGTAKVYTDAAAESEKLGKWELTLSSTAVETNYGSSIPFFEVDLSGINIGDSFSFYFGAELFDVSIGATHDVANNIAAYDVTMATFEDNVVDVINNNPTNFSNLYLTSQPGLTSGTVMVTPDNLPDSTSIIFFGQGGFATQTNNFSTQEAISGSSLLIEDYDNDYTATTVEWRTLIPSTPAEELAMIKDYIVANHSNLTANIVGDVLTIEEVVQEGTTIEILDFPGATLVEVERSVPAIPASPAYYPLGKLLGIDGNNALISSAYIETYESTSAFTIDQNVFNSLSQLGTIETEEDVENLINLIILPTSNGKVRPLDITDDNFLLLDPSAYRHFFLGIAISTNGTQVTVLHSHLVSLLFNTFVKLAQSELFND